MKIRNITAGTLLAATAAFGGAAAANAATAPSDAEVQAHYEQVQKDWGNSINKYKQIRDF